jgi:hypothetical protein
MTQAEELAADLGFKRTRLYTNKVFTANLRLSEGSDIGSTGKNNSTAASPSICRRRAPNVRR